MRIADTTQHNPLEIRQAALREQDYHSEQSVPDARRGAPIQGSALRPQHC